MDWHDRFRSHYQEGTAHQCWEWQSSRYWDGYGRFRLDGKSQRASRLAYQMAHGAIAAGESVCHTCDNPACVNPGHLFAASHRANMQDRNRKGRARGGSMRGPRHPLAKLDQKAANEIRALATAGVLTQKAIAARFGVSQSVVCDIKLGKSW